MQVNRIVILIVAAVAFTVGCAKQGSTDETIAIEVKSRLYSDPALRASNLDVSVQNGEVTLKGQPATSELQLKAYKLVADTPGVKRVNDQMSVTGAPVTAALPKPAPEAAKPVARARPPAEKSAVQRTEPPPARPTSPAPGPARAEAPKPEVERRPVRTTIPAGSHVVVRMIDSVDSSKNQAGEQFRASLESPIVVDGEQVAPAGGNVTVELAAARSAGKIRGSSELELQLSKLVVHGRTYPVTSSSVVQKGGSRGKQTATRVGIGAAAGAIIGGIAGGGKGAAIGAGVGGGGAAAYQVLTKGQQVKVPSETVLDFQLQSPVTVESAAR